MYSTASGKDPRLVIIAIVLHNKYSQTDHPCEPQQSSRRYQTHRPTIKLLPQPRRRENEAFSSLEVLLLLLPPPFLVSSKESRQTETELPPRLPPRRDPQRRRKTRQRSGQLWPSSTALNMTPTLRRAEADELSAILRSPFFLLFPSPVHSAASAAGGRSSGGHSVVSELTPLFPFCRLSPSFLLRSFSGSWLAAPLRPPANRPHPPAFISL